MSLDLGGVQLPLNAITQTIGILAMRGAGKSNAAAAMVEEEVAALTGYAAEGGGFNNALSKLRTLELVQGRGELRASEDLF